MKKALIFVVLILLSVTLISARSVYYELDKDYTYKEKIVESKYYPEKHQAYSKTTYINYDNENRYSTDNYKYGYTYRSTTEYKDRFYKKKIAYRDYSDYKKDYSQNYKKNYYKDYNRDYRSYKKNSKQYYYEYVPHLREYQKKGCYNEPPKGKLFYIKC